MGEKRSADQRPVVRNSDNKMTAQVLDDRWPFSDTLERTDPYIIDLLSKLEE